MRILLINNGYPTKNNPQYTTYIKTIKEALEMVGIKVDLFVMNSDFKKNKLLKVYNYLKYYLRLFFFKKYHEYDYVYINNYPYSFIPLIFKLKKMDNLIIHWHGDDIFANNNIKKLLNKISYVFIPKNCKHIAPSKYFANAVSKTLNIDEKDIFISSSGGVDTEVFKPRKKKKEGFHIGFASQVCKEKGFDLFAKMIDEVELLEKIFGVELYFHYINYGPEKDIYYQKYKNNEKVIIHSVYPKDKMYEFYNEIDLLLLLSTRLAESLGLVSLEAMSCDIPVVGTDGFAIKEYIISGYTGEKFELRNYNKMIEAIKKVIINYNKYKPRELIIKKYSIKSVAKGYKEYFNV